MAEPPYDVVILGTGSAGKPLAGELTRAGRSVVVVEQHLVGGECPYLACIPSKAMLISGREHLRAGGRPGTPDPEAFAAAVAVRDKVAHHQDDSGAEKHMQEEGSTLLRGRGRVLGRAGDAAGPGAGWRVEVALTAGGATEVTATNLVLATGTRAVVPPVEGLSQAPTWTSDQALTSPELPRRLAVLGGGAVGTELAQVYASFGSGVTLVESAPGLLPRESGWVGQAVASALRDLGVDVRVGRSLERVTTADGVATLHLDDGSTVEVDRILLGVGRKPRLDAGLEAIGLDPESLDGPVPVDARLRVIVEDRPLDDVFAIGDVTGVAPYTHTANYQARTLGAHLTGSGLDADYTGIPRVVYTEPAVLCAGLTPAEAADRGIAFETATFDARQTSRSGVQRTADSYPFERSEPAGVELVADAHTGVLIGASAVGPEADSWGAELALAVRTRTTVHTLAQALHAFPSWTEAIHPPARELAMRCGRS
ncbi:dihydrolipoyl dehydrogenase family protein [Spongisporangium articulatum]|uniref:Dihydrolipoyl dehydrogenase family protein n=1 Tax=Spongisporangium articulatum TaxID=3362603 RepID=A0ABW8AJC4_9ACTN